MTQSFTVNGKSHHSDGDNTKYRVAAAAAAAAAADRLQTYVIFWCIYQLLHDWYFGSLALQGPYEAFQLSMIVLLLVFHDKPPLIVATFLIRCGGLLVRLPKAFDAEFLGFITDWTVAMAVLVDTPELLPQAMRLELGWFYVAAAFWKINTAFLNPQYSCGTTYAVQLVAMLGLPSSSSSSFSVTTTRLAQFIMVPIFGYVTIVLEGMIGVAALASPKTGALATVLCLALHIGITLTPPPNNIAGFGVLSLMRFWWLIPLQHQHHPADGVGVGDTSLRRNVLFSVKSLCFYVIPSAAIFLGACAKLHSEASHSVQSVTMTRWDWPAGIFGAVTAILGLALYHTTSLDMLLLPLFRSHSSSSSSSSSSTQQQQQEVGDGTTAVVVPTWKRVLVVGGGLVLLLLWAFGSIMLGILDGASPNMFSNIRMRCGSNHWILPTGLLHQWYYNDPTSVFGGGEWRVESSNSSLLNMIHPGEMTSILSTETRRILTEEIGYTGRFYNSLVANVVGPHVMSPKDYNSPRRPRYTLPAYEIHRVLFEEATEGPMKAIPVEITVTKLDGPTGDEAWRRHSGNRTVTLVFSPRYPQLASCHAMVHMSDSSGSSKKKKKQPCDEGQDLFYASSMAAQEPENHSFWNWIGTNLQMWNSYVIYEDEDDTELHCYGS